MFGHVAEDFLAALSCFGSSAADDAKIAAEPAELRVQELAAQTFRFLEAIEDQDCADAGNVARDDDNQALAA